MNRSNEWTSVDSISFLFMLPTYVYFILSMEVEWKNIIDK